MYKRYINSIIIIIIIIIIIPVKRTDCSLEVKDYLLNGWLLWKFSHNCSQHPYNIKKYKSK